MPTAICGSGPSPPNATWHQSPSTLGNKKWAGAIPAHYQQTMPFPADAYQFQYVQ